MRISCGTAAQRQIRSFSSTRCSPSQRPRRCAVTVTALKAGDSLPPFELETDASASGTKTVISSKDMVKETGAVIFVYPQACTSGCTFQANAFKTSAPEFEKAGYKIFGLSADPPAVQAGWKSEHGLTYPLLSDTTKSVLGKLGCLTDDGKIKRAHFIVSKGGKVADANIGVSSKDSEPLALAFVKGKA